jgi:thiosulfate/3-mercaptopyruvate sulfurtransferase
MKRNILFVLALLFTTSLMAQDIIKVDDLVKIQKEAGLVIISAGTDAEYTKAHITNAIHVPYTAFDKDGDIKGLLVSDAEMAKILGDKGVSEKSKIVVYDEFGRSLCRTHLFAA